MRGLQTLQGSRGLFLEHKFWDGIVHRWRELRGPPSGNG
jgi:hypothetical protein